MLALAQVIDEDTLTNDFWSSWALQAQQSLSADLPISVTLIPQTHNSYNAVNRNYRGVNQEIDMYDQLELGVRGLSLDVHAVQIVDEKTEEPNARTTTRWTKRSSLTRRRSRLHRNGNAHQSRGQGGRT